jgi:hypothetical protein
MECRHFLYCSSIKHKLNASKNLSLRSSRGREKNLDENIKRGNAFAFLGEVPPILKFLTFLETTALQLCKLLFSLIMPYGGYGEADAGP